VVNPFAALIRIYQRYIWLPGTVFGLILLAGLFGVAFRWRRGGREALLPWLCSVALIVVPAATAEFDYRYVTTAMPFACLAVLSLFASGPPGSAVFPRRKKRSSVQTAERPFGSPGDDASGVGVTDGIVTDGVSGGEPGRAPGLPRHVPGGGPGGGTADTGHDQRDLAPDAP